MHIKQYQRKSNNLRVIEEEIKDQYGDQKNPDTVTDDTFYPENLRSAKNRISRLLKQKMTNESSAAKKVFSSSIESDLMANTTALPVKSCAINFSPTRSVKKRYRESSENSSQSLTSRVLDTKAIVRDGSKDRK